MSPASRPQAVPFAAGSGELPPPLGPALTEPDTNLLLIVAPDTGDGVLRAAIGLAEARAIEGYETVLADATLASPRLHELLDVPNLEGLADVFEFGASVGRVMTRPDTRRFDFIPAGAYAPEPGAILRSDRWDRVVDELAAEGALVMVFVPADTPGLDALSRRAGAAILLSDPRSVDRVEQALDPGCEVVALVEPVGPVTPDRLSAQAGAMAGREATIFDEPELTEPVVFRSDKRRQRIAPFLWVLLAAVLVAGAWFAYRQYAATPEPLPPAPPQPVEAAPEPEPVETPIGFSVAVEAHQDPATARERLQRVREQDSDVTFYIAPVPIGGGVWFRLLAGPVRDREAGLTLMQRLVDTGVKSAFDDWAVRPTTLAFHLGEFASRAAAETRVTELAEREIPAYVVPIRYEPEETRYRVYGGAFETRTAASVMQEMLTDVGVDAPLIERVGEPLEVGE